MSTTTPRTTLGLRERKKLEQRQRIIDCAYRMFAESGFEQTTMSAVASKADVSAKTVFNYFPTKEDLFFACAAGVEHDIAGPIKRRPSTQSVVAAVRADMQERLDRLLHAEFYAGLGSRGRIILDSPALQSKVRTFFETQERAVTEQLQRERTTEDGVPAEVAAAMIVAVIRLALDICMRGAAAGRPAEEVHAEATALVERSRPALEATTT
ncbi:TetR/AcrR family transcriptional regulator [Streptomyces sp. BA2]|uniref:TetR/AcrR family transcriptional regulator n=1 Tax=Streptomyces sp. BA2 TaxID=436595 RepID=UPI001321538D|nr:TetR/AcrR family transcriptional regulator [Streptomyces sp. BA2]MWA16246.1 TetR family transcriptional regulator [Streptomyces sp. BA2]